jgi:dsRNA-specific ribonuclease
MPDKALCQSMACRKPPGVLPGRPRQEWGENNMTDRIIVNGVTVDDYYARTLDDAIWIEPTDNGNWLLTVSIADVSSVVPRGGVEDNLASTRAFTVYVEGESKMSLLSQHTEKMASLAPGQEKPVVFVQLRYDSEFKLIDQTAGRGLLRSSVKLSFEDFENMFFDQHYRFHGMAAMMLNLASNLREKRKGIPLTSNTLTDEDGRLIYSVGGELGRAVLQELMVAANRAAAEIVMANNHNMIFYNRTNGHNQFISSYSSTNIGHAHLGLDAYAHFTSPIWRYVDLVNQRCLLAAISGSRPAYQLLDLEKIAVTANQIKLNLEAKTGVDAASSLAKIISRRAWRTTIERMDAVSFRKYLRNGTVGNPDVTNEIIRRATEGLLTCGDVSFVLFSPESTARAALKETLLSHVAAHPEQVRVVWLHGVNEHGLSDYTSTCTQEEGRWSSQVTAGDRMTYGFGHTPTEARGWALIEHMRKHLSLNRIQVTADAKPMADNDPKSRLADMCRVAGWGDPDFNLIQVGRTYDPSFVCAANVTIDERQLTMPSAWGSSKKAAQEGAATIAIDLLRPLASAAIERSLKESGLDFDILRDSAAKERPIIALETFCKRHGVEKDVFFTVEQPKDKRFECYISFRTNGVDMEIHGKGETRINALHMAAEETIKKILHAVDEYERQVNREP